MGRRVNLADLALDDVDTPTLAQAPRVVVAERAEPRIELGPHRRVPIGDVASNPLNKRPVGPDEEISQLAETIRAHGIIQPLVVCSTEAYLARFPGQRDALQESRWVTLIGNRRLLAARLASRTEIDIVVNDDQAASMYEVMLIENGQRRDLPPLLEAEAIDEALRGGGLSQRELARRIGKSHVYITHRLALLKLVPVLRELFERGELTIEQAREFGELSTSDQQAIATAGRPYRRPGGNAVNTRTSARSIRITSPAVAAESIRQKFSDQELAELVRLLSEHLPK